MRRALVILLGLAACSAADDTPATTIPPPPAAPAFPAVPLRTLDFAVASEAAHALDIVAPEHRLAIAARGLAKVERGRLSDARVDSIDALAIAIADPAQRSRLIAAGLDSPEAAAGWALSCEGSSTPS